MSDYQQMYKNLFRSVEDTIKYLGQAQIDTEALFLNDGHLAELFNLSELIGNPNVPDDADKTAE